jgi:GAF domain-containing protein
MIYDPAVTLADDAPNGEGSASTIDVVALAEALESRTDDVAMAMHELAHLLVSEESIETTLRRVADLAAQVIDDCDAAGVTLVTDGGWVTTAWTDGRTLEVDEGQYQRGHGPCLQAIADKQLVRLDVEEAEELWPDFVRDARAHDVRSFLAAPLIVHGVAIGALNLYSGKPSGFTALDDVLIALFTGQASVAVGNAKVYSDAVRLTDQLHEAIGSRAVIEQAKGVLLVRKGLDADAAFEWLRQESQRRNVKLRAVAQEIVDAARSD